MKCVKIKSIRKLPNKLDRYDLTVSSTNNFFANGILIHNTSFICGNLKVRELKKYTGLFGNLRTFVNQKILPKKFKKYDVTYDDIYSSRTVIRNKDLNETVGEGYYKSDIWSDYEKLLKGYIPKGMTIYGEIVGYLTNESGMIQKNYDYKCNPRENKLMIYRITSTEENGSKREWEINEVMDFATELKKFIPQIMDYPLLYHGKLKDLYPDIPTDCADWGEQVLERLKIESKFGMEKNEPFCNNKVPREGIVIRIANDPLKEAFKLKCNKFLKMEGEAIDANALDIETQERYVN